MYFSTSYLDRFAFSNAFIYALFRLIMYTYVYIIYIWPYKYICVITYIHIYIYAFIRNMYVYVYAFLTQCMVTSTSDISIELRREPIWPCWRARKRFSRANLQPVPTFRSSPVCVHSLISLKIQSRAYTFVWLMCISHGYTFTYIYIYMIIHVSMLACTYQTNVNTDPIGQAYLDLRSEENPF